MKIRKLVSLSKEEVSTILNRGGEVDAKIKESVSEILAQVKAEGEKAVLEFTKKFDGVGLDSLEVSKEEMDAVDENSSEFDFLREAKTNIEKFHKNQLQNILQEKRVETSEGIEVWREWRSVGKVGIYSPGGLATYPSSVLMQALPAKIAGCEEIILATPPQKDGKISAVVIASAKLSGVTKILKCGGSQAIAYLAYIEKVEKITGPGNPWVTQAKTQVASKVAIDMPAGPSEILILADETAKAKFVASDLFSQAEHAKDSSAILVTTSPELAKEVEKEIETQLTKLSRKEIAKESLEKRGEILLVDSLDEAIEFANSYASEHLEICMENSEEILAKIQNAGSVFLGNYSCESAGDFATGSNHVLPTAGFAKNFNPLSVESFGKKIQIQKLSKEGLGKIREVCEKFGEVEGLDAHAKSVSIRFTDED